MEDKTTKEALARPMYPSIIPGAGKKNSALVEKPAVGYNQAALVPGRTEIAMSQPAEQESLSEARRKEIFVALVEAQDHAMTVPESRRAVAEWFGLDERQVLRIEREGLDHHWPPL